MEASLVKSLDDGALVITAHRRQARQIRFRYAAHKQAAQINAWTSPKVTGWDDWLVELHQDITWSGYSAPRNQRKLLTPFQEQILWENIIGADDAQELDDVGGAARKALAAWTQVQSYRLADPAAAAGNSADIAAFAQWMRRYFKRCREQSLMDHARLADSIAPALRAGAIAPPGIVLLVGFDDLTPQQRLLLKVLEELGTKLDLYRGARIESTARNVRLQSYAEEYTAAARWVRGRLEREEPGNIAVLAPRLRADRRRIERIFDDVLMPGSSLPSSNLGGRPYNMAIGDVFHRTPLVHTALGICQLARPVVGFENLSSLLRSPFLRGAAAEAPLRARFEVWLRSKNIARAPVEKLPALFAEFRQRAAEAFDDAVTESMLAGLHPALTEVKGTHRASGWADIFRRLLKACGWPGDTTLDSASFQTAERWRALLDEMSGLDFLTQAMGVDKALSLVRRLAQGVSFQPQTPDLSVQILVPEQAVGMHFDHLWLCGAHAGALPGPANPNPFVPRQWQREHSIPGSSASVQLERAQRLTRGLLRCAHEIVVSSPLTVDDHPVSVSPLVAHLPTAAIEELGLADLTDMQQLLQPDCEMETVDDRVGPHLAPHERQASTPGGSALFSLQAACAFRAFAQLRLGAAPLDEPEPGLNARERGSLIHTVLEHLWQRLGASDTLHELLGGDYLEQQVWEIADTALTMVDQKRPLPLAPRFRAMEHQRLIRRVLQWLQVEAQRSPFDVVRAEKRVQFSLGDVTVDLTMDRVDRLADGSLAVIDYKTGNAKVSDWFGERPMQPQLPLYALAQEEDIGAVAFALVRPKEPGFEGLSRDADQLPGVKPVAANRMAKSLGLSWDDLLAHWRGNLTQVAQAYASGAADVDPKPDACRYCHVTAFCRIGEDLRAEGDADGLGVDHD